MFGLGEDRLTDGVKLNVGDELTGKWEGTRLLTRPTEAVMPLYMEEI